MRTSFLAAFAALVFALPLAAQEPPPGARPPAPPSVDRQEPQAPRPPRPPRTFANIKLDLTIADTYAETPSTRTVTMLVMDGERGSIRTSNRLPSGPAVALNVDAVASLLPDQSGRIQLRLTFEYTPAQSTPPETRPIGPAELTESLTVVLEDGKTAVLSQSADPLTDRRVTVSVAATVLK